jgi:hypothetical protein
MNEKHSIRKRQFETRTVLCTTAHYDSTDLEPQRVCLCRCDCGKKIWVCRTCLLEGLIRDCGCKNGVRNE